MLIIGIDLAWGAKGNPKPNIQNPKNEYQIIKDSSKQANIKGDGICFINANRTSAEVIGFAYPRGDAELMECLKDKLTTIDEAFLTIDAPIICPNRTGTRPVDRLTHRLFHREHAACHPANSTKCPRPKRILKNLRKLGVEAGWELKTDSKITAEVYPHPAMVRLFKLDRIFKYKKGPIAVKQKEFKRYQKTFHKFISKEFPDLQLNTETRLILKGDWTKTVEDKLDALFCAVLGLWHYRYNGKRSAIIGNIKTGFILLPEDLRLNKPVR